MSSVGNLVCSIYRDLHTGHTHILFAAINLYPRLGLGQVIVLVNATLPRSLPRRDVPPPPNNSTIIACVPNMTDMCVLCRIPCREPPLGLLIYGAWMNCRSSVCKAFPRPAQYNSVRRLSVLCTIILIAWNMVSHKPYHVLPAYL